MATGIGIIGREVTFTLGSATLLGVNSKSWSFNNEPLDTTDDASSGWQERLAKAGVKNIEFSFSGLVKNLELINAYVGTSQLFAVLVTYPDGASTNSTLAFDAFLDTVSQTGESNGLVTYEASFSSSGTPTFTAGT